MVAAEVSGRWATRGLGWGAKRIARELRVARNTVRRYLRGAPAEVQEHLAARCLDAAARAEALRLFDGEAEGNAVVVAAAADHGVAASVRTVQRAVEHRRRSQRASQVATVRFETCAGEQMPGRRRPAPGAHRRRFGARLLRLRRARFCARLSCARS